MTKVEWIERDGGELVLTIYAARKRWFRMRSRWCLEFRTPFEDAHLCYEIGSGWGRPCWNLMEIHVEGRMKELLCEF